MILITENFRYPSGQVASEETIVVKDRGAETLPDTWQDPAGTIPSPLETDSLGNLSFYIIAGNYDFEIRGLRIPFDAVAPTGGPGGGEPGAHTHVISDVTGLQTALNSKASAGTAAALALVLGG